MDFSQLPVNRKCVCFTDVSDNRIDPGPAVRVGYILNGMPGVVEHRPDHVVEAGIHTCKDSGDRGFNHIRSHQECSGFTDQEFAGFKHQRQLFAVGLAEILKTLADLLSEFLHVCGDIVFLVGDFEATPKIDVFQIGEAGRHAEKDVTGIQENFHIQNIGSGMHVQTCDLDSGRLDHA